MHHQWEESGLEKEAISQEALGICLMGMDSRDGSRSVDGSVERSKRILDGRARRQ